MGRPAWKCMCCIRVDRCCCADSRALTLAAVSTVRLTSNGCHQYFQVSDLLSARVHFCQGKPHIHMQTDCGNERWERARAVLLSVRGANQSTKEVSCSQGYVQSWPRSWWCSLDSRLGLKENASFAFHVLGGT